MLDKLSSSLKETLKKIARAVFVDDALINEIVKDIQRALLQADVNVKLVFGLSERIKERALKEKPPKGVGQREFLINIVYEELVAMLGREKSELKIDKKGCKIMMVGLFGSGKTTSIGKLAKFYSNRGHKVAAVGLDVHRPAASAQLKQVCDKVGIKSFVWGGAKETAISVYKKFEKEFTGYDILIFDTAGRASIDKELTTELRDLNNMIKPDENLLVISADIGQSAMEQASEFHKTCGITGVFVTKMDGTAKAGGALSACAATGAMVKFIGVGEKMDDLEIFNPTGFVSRMLGMGDLEALLEKAKGIVEEEKTAELGKKLLKGEFSLLDLYEQLQAVRKMGPLSKLVDMIPGLGGAEIPSELFNVQEEKLKKWKYIMQSMTRKELENPELINKERIERIAKGSGVDVGDVRELLKQYKQGKKLMKLAKGVVGDAGKMERMEKLDMNKLMKKIGGAKGLKGLKGFKRFG